jgi:two-component sensor histidine kinase
LFFATSSNQSLAQNLPTFEMSYFEDVNDSHSFTSIKQEKFKPSPEHLISLGIIKSTIWVKIKIDTTLLSPETVLQINRPFLDDITLSYLLKGNKEVRESLGLKYPHSKNKFNHFLPVFAIPINKLESPYLYLKVQSRYSMLIPVSISSKETFYKERVNLYLTGGLLIGGLLLMALYNLFLYFSTRDFSYVLYVLSLFGAILSQGYIFGILIPYLSPESPEFSFRFPVIIMAMTAIFALLFAIRFLEVKKQNKTLYYILVSLIVFELFGICLELLHLDYISRKVNLLQVVTLSITIFSTALYCLIKGNKIALYFTIAWSFYLSGMIVFALKTGGILPHNTFTAHFMHVGTFLEVMLLSFALGHKYSLVRVEKERLEQQTKEELELLVKKQTLELEQSLKEKDVLLKEVHHRVKNNLQMVISLLDLQVASIKDSKNKETLLQSKARVYSMSLIHQKLYQTDDLAHVNMKNYLEELFSYIKNSFHNTEQKITHNLEIEDKELSLTKAVPLGLIINELLTNCFKHSVQAKECNQINLSLAFKENNLVLKVLDSGEGFDEEKAEKGVKKSLGLFLINSLTKQLRGTVTRYQNNGLFVTQLIIPLKKD